jgi:phospho-N-acetylmuramoyl-pentapeptide-transferase
MMKLFIFIIFINIVYIVLIKFLNRLKLYQKIYSLCPKTHKKKKATPSFGGVGIIVNIIFGLYLFQIYDFKYVKWIALTIIVFAAIGFFDDFLSLLHDKNKGLSATNKFILQAICSLILLFCFDLFVRPIAFYEYLIYWFAFVGGSNATNITDGLDGLLTGLSVITLSGFVILFFSISLFQIKSLCLIAGITLLFFLIYNFRPAKIYMGDTGSLALGALFASLALVADSIWIMLPFCMVYIIETMSVIIQVVYFKLTKKRVFLMAPLHHHFELLGMSERKTVFLFWFIGLVSLLVYFFGFHAKGLIL